LALDRQVPVEDAEPTLACERDREPRLGDRVHRGRNDRDLERDRPRQARRRGDLVRQYRRLGGHEQDVVESQPLTRKLPIELDQALDRLRRELYGQLAADGSNGGGRSEHAGTVPSGRLAGHETASQATS
jgi:hypothetical protein